MGAHVFPRGRARQRGAVMVEAVVVIAFFMIALLGVMYFKALYVTKIRSMRAARAATLNYALAACEGDPGPAVRSDTGLLQPSRGSSNERITNDRSTHGGVSSNPDARGALDKSGAGASDGTFLNPIGNVGYRGTAAVGARGGSSMFSGTVRSTSYASCPDRVRPWNRDFVEVIGYIGNTFFHN